jgi:hypothetical protein
MVNKELTDTINRTYRHTIFVNFSNAFRCRLRQRLRNLLIALIAVGVLMLICLTGLFVCRCLMLSSKRLILNNHQFSNDCDDDAKQSSIELHQAERSDKRIKRKTEIPIEILLCVFIYIDVQCLF